MEKIEELKELLMNMSREMQSLHDEIDELNSKLEEKEKENNHSTSDCVDSSKIQKNADPKKVDTLVLCSGKFYYEATDKADQLGADNMAFVRIEQLYPLPKIQIDAILKKYKNAKNIIWAQEEPANMGAWTYMAMELRELNLTGICRYSSAAAAEGSHDLHKRRLERLFNELFAYAKVNA